MRDSMRLCLIGDFSVNLEEGMRKTAFYLSEELSKHHHILLSPVEKIFFRNFWRDIKEFNPQIIHYIPGASIKSFIIVKILTFYCESTKTVVSATLPSHFHLTKKIIPFVKPDLILTQSNETEKIFTDLGCNTDFLPSGVDTKKFVPVSEDIKEGLRRKYGIEKEKFVILHVGSIKEGRGVKMFKALQTKEDQVVIIGNRFTGIEKQLYQSIIESGCEVWTKYFDRIEEIYALSDCYVFPTLPATKSNAIEMPLSVLEAISCNLPVITTKFGALPRVFEESDGLIFVDKEEEFIDAVEKTKKIDTNIKTREKVLPYSWKNVIKRLEEIYEKLVEDKG
jgi:glycosyltransferase involved in cell wall biosynthesis